LGSLFAAPFEQDSTGSACKDGELNDSLIEGGSDDVVVISEAQVVVGECE
jgi:hypothetical protein